MSPYCFRSFTTADLSIAERWLAAPEVMRWWGQPEEQLALLTEDLEEPRMRQWIVECQGRPFAYLQAYLAQAWPQTHLQRLPAGAQVIDTFIGDPDMIGYGHGSRYLRMFADLLMTEGVSAVATDPALCNVRARRAYARAGFAETAVLDSEQGRVVLMVYQAHASCESPRGTEGSQRGFS